MAISSTACQSSPLFELLYVVYESLCSCVSTFQCSWITMSHVLLFLSSFAFSTPCTLYLHLSPDSSVTCQSINSTLSSDSSTLYLQCLSWPRYHSVFLSSSVPVFQSSCLSGYWPQLCIWICLFADCPVAVYKIVYWFCTTLQFLSLFSCYLHSCLTALIWETPCSPVHFLWQGIVVNKRWFLRLCASDHFGAHTSTKCADCTEGSQAWPPISWNILHF